MASEETSDSAPSLADTLPEAVRFSACGLCAMSVQHLFAESCHHKFGQSLVERLVKHFNLGKQVFETMSVLMEDGVNDIDGFVRIIKEEPQFGSSCDRLIEDLVLLSVGSGVYDSRLRVLSVYVASLLDVPELTVEEYEQSVVSMLCGITTEDNDQDIKDKAKAKRKKKIKRYALIGLGSVAGGALIGLTGGLAAPFVAAGAGAIIGTAGAAALGTTVGIATIGSLFGVAGAGLTGYKMKRRVGGIEEFAFETLSAGTDLRLTIAITGWIANECPHEFSKPWMCLDNSQEQYALRYESKYLLPLGKAMDYLVSAAVTVATEEALKYTIAGALIAAIAWPAALVSVAGVIDNPWSVGITRSAQVGKQLAEVLHEERHGRRPVTMIGFSLGARVVFHCLKKLVKMKNCEGIVENAILIGAPVPASSAEWTGLERVVAGRLVNCYCKSDWVLKFLYRTSSASVNVAGLQPIEWHHRIMVNYDVGHIVQGHLEYPDKIKQILDHIGVRTKQEEIVECRFNRAP